jgi:hypothetical protein
VSPATLAIGGDVPTEGRDKREGLAITIHAVGTAIRREARADPLVPEMVVRLGALR